MLGRVHGLACDLGLVYHELGESVVQVDLFLVARDRHLADAKHLGHLEARVLLLVEEEPDAESALLVRKCIGVNLPGLYFLEDGDGQGQQLLLRECLVRRSLL